MADTVTDFFDDLARREHVPTLERLTGTLRVELEHPRGLDRWLVQVNHGDVTVSRRNAKADCVLRTDRELFGAIASGQVNALAAMLRGQLGIEGDPNLLVAFQRAFPGPQDKRRQS